MRITRKDLEIMAKRVNELLNCIKLRISRRYNYIAIDVEKNGKIYDTLIAGLRIREAYDILYCLEQVLSMERR